MLHGTQAAVVLHGPHSCRRPRRLQQQARRNSGGVAAPVVPAVFQEDDRGMQQGLSQKVYHSKRQREPGQHYQPNQAQHYPPRYPAVAVKGVLGVHQKGGCVTDAATLQLFKNRVGLATAHGPGTRRQHQQDCRDAADSLQPIRVRLPGRIPRRGQDWDFQEHVHHGRHHHQHARPNHHLQETHGSPRD